MLSDSPARRPSSQVMTRSPGRHGSGQAVQHRRFPRVRSARHQNVQPARHGCLEEPRRLRSDPA